MNAAQDTFSWKRSRAVTWLLAVSTVTVVVAVAVVAIIA